MYESLHDNASDFHLYIFAFDDLTNNILRDKNLENVTVVSLKDFENPELLEVKKERSKAEYCWTCTPSVISYVIKKYGVPACTYIDSDLYFYSDPAILVDEMPENNKSVLITEHRFSTLPRLYEEKRAGRFCVQFITFLNKEDSLQVLEKWRKQCIDWCYARYEDGKFGDQKYLDEWPAVYNNIHILQNHGGGVAPWNLMSYKFSRNKFSITGKLRKSGIRFKVVFFHFQYVKIHNNDTFDIGWYHITESIKKDFYVPYLRRIKEIEKELRIQNDHYKTGFTSFRTDSLKDLLKTGFKKMFGYNILKSI
jgi:hypothetical protein